MKTHLILDRQSVADARGVTFHLNRATKHAENPVMSPGEPHHWDSLCVSWPGTVLYSARDQTFRCWYTGMDIVQSPDRTWHTGYAQSDDGIHWRKPDCKQSEFLGASSNRLKPDWQPYFLSLAFENPRADAPPSQRFGGYWTEYRFIDETKDWKTSQWSKTLAWSADGITWKRDGTAYGEKLRAPFNDISQVLFDPDDPDESRRWKAYGQLFVPRSDGKRWPGTRNIGLAHGASAARVEDAANPIVLSPVEGIDEELHFAAVQKIGGSYLMLFESDRFEKNPIHGDLRLAVSNDGEHFRRVHPHTPILETGPKGMWDENMLVTSTAGWQHVGDEHWIFYFGCPRTYNSWPAQYSVGGDRMGSRFAPVFLGVATLPRDRFGYAEGPGDVEIESSTFAATPSSNLWLNADGDDLTIAALDPAGRETARGRIGQERTLGVYRRVKWETKSDPRRHRVRITLPAGARLYSIASPPAPR